MANNHLGATPAPALPFPDKEYAAGYFQDFANILRLYFNKVSTVLNKLTGDAGGRFLSVPYASFSSIVTQSTTANTPTRVALATIDFITGFTGNGAGGLVATYSGLYNVQYSFQFENTDTIVQDVWVWLRKSGVDIANTGTTWDVPSKHGSSNGYAAGAANFFVSLNAGEYIELYWAVSSATVGLEAYAATPTTPFAKPGIPSVVATIMFVSAI